MNEFVTTWNRGNKHYARVFAHLSIAQAKAREMSNKGAKDVQIRHQIVKDTGKRIRIHIVSWDIPF